MTDAKDASTTSRFALSSDGLRLHYRDFGDPLGTALPVVCLPGLTRTAEDFDLVAASLAGDPTTPRRVLALDYRGRGLSDRDPDASNYTIAVETGDVLAVLAAAGVTEAVIVGTSRGGLIALTLAGLAPRLIRGTVLNDIGPVLDPAGILRIRGYVGRLPVPRSWNDAVTVIQSYAGTQFVGLSEADWLAFARTTFSERDGTFAIRYDPALMRSLDDLDVAALPELWPQFDALGHAPLLVVRGEFSDLLSAATAVEMTRRHPDAALATIAGQGHAPLLRDEPTLDLIAAFARRCDRLRGALSNMPGSSTLG